MKRNILVAYFQKIQDSDNIKYKFINKDNIFINKLFRDIISRGDRT